MTPTSIRISENGKTADRAVTDKHSVQITITVPVKSKATPHTIEALGRSADAPFVVNRTWRADGSRSDFWVITHRDTGFAIPRLLFETPDLALAAADRFCAVPGLDGIKADGARRVSIDPALAQRLTALVLDLEAE